MRFVLAALVFTLASVAVVVAVALATTNASLSPVEWIRLLAGFEPKSLFFTLFCGGDGPLCGERDTDPYPDRERSPQRRRGPRGSVHKIS